MPPATTAAGSGVSIQSRHSTNPFSLKPHMAGPSSSISGPIRVDGSEYDAGLSKSDLTRTELLDRRARRVRQLAGIYRDHYWALMEELKLKYREYYWEFGKSPFVDDEGNNSNGNCTGTEVKGENVSNNGNLKVKVKVNGGNHININFTKCSVNGCKAKAMALTKFCHMHILSDPNQKLYKACTFTIKCSTTGPILCRKPILRTADPSYCAFHLQKAEKEKGAALRKNKRKAAQKAKIESSS